MSYREYIPPLPYNCKGDVFAGCFIIVAEGVETDYEADILQDLECDEIQGYLIARPMHAVDVASFLRTHTERAEERRLQLA